MSRCRATPPPSAANWPSTRRVHVAEGAREASSNAAEVDVASRRTPSAQCWLTASAATMASMARRSASFSTRPAAAEVACR